MPSWRSRCPVPLFISNFSQRALLVKELIRKNACKWVYSENYTSSFDRKALSELNNWVVIMFFLILIKLCITTLLFYSILMLCNFKFSFFHRAWTMSPEQSQYIWRKTIPHIEVGMGSGVFTSHRSARFVLISDWWTRRKMELLDFFFTRPRLRVVSFGRPPPVEAS